MDLEIVKRMSLVDYLASLGFLPAKKSGKKYWYLSPLRIERTASFCIDLIKNQWYDFGIGVGGSIIDFGIKYFNCSFKEFMERMASETLWTEYLLPKKEITAKNKMMNEQAIEVVRVGDIENIQLIGYLQFRNIDLRLAKKFLKEVKIEFLKTGRKLIVLGLKNRKGGYEFRSEIFKGSNSPKDISFINNASNSLVIIEGMFDMLSTMSIQNFVPLNTNWMVLNSVTMINRAMEIIKNHQEVYLVLDNDLTGKNCSELIISFCKENNIITINKSDAYSVFNDVSEWYTKLTKSYYNPELGYKYVKGSEI